MTQETWRDVPGYGGLYEASSLGRVATKSRVVSKRTRHGGMMTQRYGRRILSATTIKGYKIAHIGINGQKLRVGIHRLVLMAFCGEAGPGQITRHLNGDPADNRPENLAWGDHQENMLDRKRHGRYAVGEHHCMAKITKEQALHIKSSTASGADLARAHGIGQSQVSRIRRGTSWQEAL